MNLTVPREHLFEQSDGTLWFVGYGDTSYCNVDHLEFVPPADLVALAAPCETCGNTRTVGNTYGDCGDCADRTLTIETPVPIVSWMRRPRGSTPYVGVAPNGCWLVSGDDGEDPEADHIDLGPNPARFVGWYAVKAVTA